jgi:hypothetical protein
MYGRIDNMYVCSRTSSGHWCETFRKRHCPKFNFQRRNFVMSKFTKLIPALAVAVALSPFAFGAAGAAIQNGGYSARTAISSPLAANSKGRPAEFSPAPSAEVAVISKGRPGEFAANSKGRPAEFTPAASAQVADNSRGRPGEFSNAPGYETPMG